MQNRDRTEPERLAEVSAEARIDAICDAYETEWNQGTHREFASYLEHCDPTERPRLFLELLLVDRELRLKNAQEPEWLDYLIKFPAFAEQIEAARFKYRSEGLLRAGPDAAVPEIQRIGRFELVHRIGAGASGEVWKANDPRLQRTVAIKIPRVRLPSENELSRFLREGRAAAQLKHANIVPVYEVDRDGDTAYIVSALIAGEDLRAWMRHSQPSETSAAELCRQLADALQHAHQQGVIHRDLKPGNVIIDEFGHPHIADFGLAKWVDDGREITLDGQLLGTPAYMSPEQARGEAATADARTDVYALGVLLYELLTRRCPFAGGQAAVVHQIIHNEPQRPRTLNQNIPRDLETICLKAMEKEASCRYASAQAMAVDLHRFLLGEPILARPQGFFERHVKRIRRRPLRAATTLLAVLVLSLGGVAGRLSRENHALLGLQTITLASEPPGAKVVFVPLEAATGEPAPAKKIRALGRTPIQQELKPGEYLVVAVLDDGRFHEVYRQVPGSGNEMPGVYSHHHWLPREDGTITMDSIRIPDHSVNDGMALVHSAVPEQPDFYIDCQEFTLAEHQALVGQLPSDRRARLGAPDSPVNVDFDRAVSLAEKLGKRLPSDAEFEIVRAQLVTPPVSNLAARSVGGAHTVVQGADHAPTLNEIVNLTSGAGEWTISRQQHFSSADRKGMMAISADYRVVRGVASAELLDRSPGESKEAYGDMRIALPRHAVKPGLGFRCVRSQHPRFMQEEVQPPQP